MYEQAKIPHAKALRQIGSEAARTNATWCNIGVSDLLRAAADEIERLTAAPFAGREALIRRAAEEAIERFRWKTCMDGVDSVVVGKAKAALVEEVVKALKPREPS